MLVQLLVAAVLLPAVHSAPDSVLKSTSARPTVAPIAMPKPAPAVTVDGRDEMDIVATPSTRTARVATWVGMADSIVVSKSAHTLTLFSRGLPVRAYLVAIGKNPTGHKEQAGDNKTPEGLYYIDSHNPESKFHRALHISYPNATDRARAASRGVATGGDIMVHGLPAMYSDVGAVHREYDWTNGCIALTNAEIEEIYRAVPNGTPIEIKP